MIIVDTSAWVEFLRGTGSQANLALRTTLADGETVGVVDVVRLELLAGAGDDAQLVTVSRLLALGVPIAPLSPCDHDDAAALHRAARRAGHTVRSLIDCIVAAVALRLQVPVLARDRDFEVLAAVSPLRLHVAHGGA